VPVLLRLLQTATLVTDPAAADAFVVPFTIGTYQTIVRWMATMWERANLVPIKKLTADLATLLPYLNASTARRHVFFQSVDSAFVGLAEQGVAPWIPPESIVFHLGDDLYYYGRIKQFSPIKRATRYNNSIVIPYRSFLPPAFDARHPWPEDVGESAGRRPLLVFGAFNLRRHWLRVSLVEAINRTKELAPGRVFVGSTTDFKSLAEAASFQYNSTFCLCPSGDAPSFTQRLYVSVLHGCIPVRIDTYMRYPSDPEGVESAYPFPNSIDWNRMSLTLSANGGNSTTKESLRGGWLFLKSEFFRLIPRLLAMEASGEAQAMRAYVRHIAPLLAFDAHSKTGQLHRQDAASAALYELAIKLGKPLPSGSAGHHRPYNRSAGPGRGALRNSERSAGGAGAGRDGAYS